MTYRIELGQERSDDLSFVIVFRNAATGGRILSDYVEHQFFVSGEGYDYGEFGEFDAPVVSNASGGIVPQGPGVIAVTVPREVLGGYGLFDNGSWVGGFGATCRSSVRFRLTAAIRPDFSTDFDPEDFATETFAPTTLRDGASTTIVSPTARASRVIAEGVLSFGESTRPRVKQVAIPVYPNSPVPYSDLPPALGNTFYAPGITLNVLPLYPQAPTASYKIPIAA